MRFRTGETCTISAGKAGFLQRTENSIGSAA
jgi:hypothetical protein